MQDRFLGVKEQLGDVFQALRRAFDTRFDLWVLVHDEENGVE